jgi:hypothetical protein
MAKIVILSLILISIGRLTSRHVATNDSADITTAVIAAIYDLYQFSGMRKYSPSKLATGIYTAWNICV